MKQFTKQGIFFALFCVLLFSACKGKRNLNLPQLELTAKTLVPKPATIKATNKSFPLDQFTAIETEKEFENEAKLLATDIKKQTQIDIKVNPTATNTIETFIRIKKSEEKLQNTEGYVLKITPEEITILANNTTGVFWGMQTLRQLIPNKANDQLADYKIWIIPTGEITDQPQFVYRGVMLDVARHFFSVEDVKKLIDNLAYYKINTLHLHLTDDQGWRIEIKAYPKLTEIGGQTEVGGESGGFYTQKQYTDLVNYAAARHISIIPEIDMPGHTNAASLSYPFLNGNGKNLKPYEGTEVGFSTFDAKKEKVYEFIDTVIGELAALTPSPYIHIGGDESHVTKKDDYNVFITKVGEIAKRHGKRIIGWDEIATTNVNNDAITHFWYNEKNAEKAINRGMKIIISPAKKAYLDMKYDKGTKLGLNWAGYINVQTGYDWSPETYTKAPMENILGIEAPLWTETVANNEDLEYMIFPRAIGYAELGWTPLTSRNWDDYKVRLANQTPFLERMNINFYRSPLINWLQTNK